MGAMDRITVDGKTVNKKTRDALAWAGRKFHRRYPKAPWQLAQGSYNNSLIHDSDDLAIVAGIEIGNWFHKKPAAVDIRPMIIPDTSFEMTTRERPVEETP